MCICVILFKGVRVLRMSEQSGRLDHALLLSFPPRLCFSYHHSATLQGLALFSEESSPRLSEQAHSPYLFTESPRRVLLGNQFPALVILGNSYKGSWRYWEVVSRKLDGHLTHLWPRASTTTPNRRLHLLIHRTISAETSCCARSLARYLVSLPPLAAPRHIGAVDLLPLAETLSPLATQLSLPAVQLAGACLSALTHLCVPEASLAR